MAGVPSSGSSSGIAAMLASDSLDEQPVLSKVCGPQLGVRRCARSPAKLSEVCKRGKSSPQHKAGL